MKNFSPRRREGAKKKTVIPNTRKAGGEIFPCSIYEDSSHSLGMTGKRELRVFVPSWLFFSKGFP